MINTIPVSDHRGRANIKKSIQTTGFSGISRPSSILTSVSFFYTCTILKITKKVRGFYFLA